MAHPSFNQLSSVLGTRGGQSCSSCFNKPSLKNASGLMMIQRTIYQVSLISHPSAYSLRSIIQLFILLYLPHDLRESYLPVKEEDQGSESDDRLVLRYSNSRQWSYLIYIAIDFFAEQFTVDGTTRRSRYFACTLQITIFIHVHIAVIAIKCHWMEMNVIGEPVNDVTKLKRNCQPRLFS